ncbi:MAG TPA: LLM class flavin-dependent oxidoreductase [Micrococcales bacterium]|uniref:LLM class flavin-dependent oxidoreductase n=1 Tax=Miniimonas arenae TaxID=676201 RepID=UPI000EB817A5|nr:LLM class flavin-dependent oxidoreductase [Miniimonas arenae]HCX83673.1 LLM class flavin-dependent oxidoreductase [Micrococcales bacterium]
MRPGPGPSPLHVGLSLSHTWLRGAAWRRPDSRVEELLDVSVELDLARSAEQVGVDFLLKPDAAWLDPTSLVDGPGFTMLDPTVLLSAIATHTSRIGLVTTLGTAFGEPYQVARAVRSLDRISHGRAGWNVVTALGGAQNVARRLPAASKRLGHDGAGETRAGGVRGVGAGEIRAGAADTTQADASRERYAEAREFVDVVRALWASYPAGAVLADREGGRYADASLVRPIQAQGHRFEVAGPLNVAGSNRIPLFQAGGSPSGRDLAARTADAVFALAPTEADALEQRTDLRARAVRHGRAPDDVRVLPGLSLYLAATREEAEELRRASEAAGANTGAPRGAGHWTVVGTPADAVAAIVERARAGAIDGVIALPSGALDSARRFLEEVVPALQRAGVVREGYAGETLADHLAIRH